MPTKTSSQSTQPIVNAEGHSKTAISRLVTILQEYCAGGELQELEALVTKNISLEKKLNDQAITNDKNLESIAKLKQETTDHDALKEELAKLKAETEIKATELRSKSDEVAKLDKQVKEKDTQIGQLNQSEAELINKAEEYTKATTDLKQRLQRKKEELETQGEEIKNLQQSLSCFESFAVRMNNCVAIKPKAYVGFTPLPRP